MTFKTWGSVQSRNSAIPPPLAWRIPKQESTTTSSNSWNRRCKLGHLQRRGLLKLYILSKRALQCKQACVIPYCRLKWTERDVLSVRRPASVLASIRHSDHRITHLYCGQQLRRVCETAKLLRICRSEDAARRHGRFAQGSKKDITCSLVREVIITYGQRLARELRSVSGITRKAAYRIRQG